MFVKSYLFLACATVPPKRSGHVPVIRFEMRIAFAPMTGIGIGIGDDAGTLEHVGTQEHIGPGVRTLFGP